MKKTMLIICGCLALTAVIGAVTLYFVNGSIGLPILILFGGVMALKIGRLFKLVILLPILWTGCSRDEVRTFPATDYSTNAWYSDKKMFFLSDGKERYWLSQAKTNSNLYTVWISNSTNGIERTKEGFRQKPGHIIQNEGIEILVDAAKGAHEDWKENAIIWQKAAELWQGHYRAIEADFLQFIDDASKLREADRNEIERLKKTASQNPL